MNNEESNAEHHRDVYLPDKRHVRFFEITGKTLVYPMAYQLYNFQKEIILATLNHNTLIGLPSGLGKNLISAIITFNFHRWFLNGKIVVLSQIRSYLTDQLHAYSLYTALQEKSFAELSANASEKDCESACTKSIILTSPTKFLNCLKKNIFPLQNLALLVVFENSKILKCAEYHEIINKITNFPFRTVLFVDPAGFNSRIIKQVVEQFNISKIETRDMYSSEIKKCTYTAEIEPIEVEISPHIVNIKDAFYSVYEKYGKKIKDAKVITGNVASITKAQIQKAKEKFLKNPPRDMSKADRDDLVDSMIMCSFLCHGIELLHNWGVRAFYNYLFDDKKDDELKILIVKDEHLTNQMKLLNEYLRTNGMKFDTAVVRLLHPKLLNLKNLLMRYFSNAKNVDSLKIIVTCSVEDVIDDIDRLFRNLPPFVRYHCIKTKAKRLSDEKEHKELIQHLQAGVISVLVVSSLIEEIFEIETTYVISLDPNKSLLKLSDARFQKTTEKCVFILTKGIEYMKFETMLNEKRHEQKPLDTSGMEQTVQKSPSLFPQDFDPEFECTSVKEAKSSLKNSPRQKTLFSYLKGSPISNSSFESRNRQMNNVIQKQHCGTESPSLFADTLNFSSSIDDVSIQNTHNIANFSFEDPVPYVPPFVNKNLSNFATINDGYDSFDELILDFPDNFYDSKNNNVNTRQEKSSVKLSENDKLGDSSSNASVISKSKSKSKVVNISLTELPNESFVDDLFDDSSHSETMDDGENYLNDNVCDDSGSIMKAANVKMVNQNRPAFVDALFEDSSDSEKTEDNKIENTPFTLSAPSVGTAEAMVSDQHDQSESPLTKDDAFDSDCEFFPPSPETIPKNKLKISSAPWESLPDHFRNNSVKTVEEKSDLKCYNFGEYSVTKDNNVFIDEPCGSVSSSMPGKNSVTSGQNSQQILEKRVEKPDSTTHNDIVQENEDRQTRMFNHSEIPSAIFNDSALESLTSALPANEKTIILPKASSPVLFSSRKSNRRRSLMSTRADQSVSIKFDSFFNISEENLQPAERLNLVNNTRTTSERFATTVNRSSTAVLEDNEDIFVNSISKSNLVSNEARTASVLKNSPSLRSNHSITFPDDDFILDSVEDTKNVPVKCSTPEAAEMKTSTPLRVVDRFTNEKKEELNNTSTPISSSRLRFMRRAQKSISLFTETDLDIQLLSPEVSPQEDHISCKTVENEPSTDMILKQRLFSSFKENVGRGLSAIKGNEDVSWKSNDLGMKSWAELDLDDDDDHPWLSKSSFITNENVNNYFKKPSPVLKNRPTDQRSSPASHHERMANHKKKRRNLVDAFIDGEAEVSDDTVDSCSSVEDCSKSSDDSFIDDENTTKAANMSDYLKWLNSSKNAVNEFQPPVLSESKWKVNVCSQVDDHEQSYERDSFCVDEDETDPGDGYVASALTQMEERLSKRRGRCKPKPKLFKRIKVIEDSSPESPVIKKTARRRIQCFSSDSDE